MNKKLTAFLSAVMLTMSTVSAYGIHAEDETVLPDWIPQSFTEAMNFDNEHGRTHIEDNIICCVRYKSTDETYSYQTEYPEKSGMKELSSETYTLTFPERPDKSDSEAWQVYIEQLTALGIPEYYVDSLPIVNFCYEVSVYTLAPSSTATIRWTTSITSREKPLTTTDLTFVSESDGTVTETDFYGWLPDSITEFYRFKNDNIISVHNGYVVYCDNVSYDGGFDVFPSQTGTAKMEEVKNYSISTVQLFAADPGGSGHIVMVYQPVTPGTVKMTFTQAQPWNMEGLGTTQNTQSYKVNNDFSITEIDDSEVLELNLGDCNLDGEFNTVDIVMLRKYLLGNGSLSCWQNADFTADNCINIYDLCLMKRALLQQTQAK